MRRSDPSPIVTRAASPDDAALLTELGASTFAETFKAENTPENFAAYMRAAFGEEIQRAELADPETTVFLAEQGSDTIGYVMLRERKPPASLELDDALEIARLYVRKRSLGHGVGAALMQRALAEAAGRGKDAVWLGVWDRNERAIRFYESWGFHRSGTQPFLLGNDLQTDLVMVRRIARES
ncbi:MAG: N-acetyltransferase [Gemmatimonadetes bacterium]|nr:MAG: N-acetyltransferase [Gemmatimonadota bacterium]